MRYVQESKHEAEKEQKVLRKSLVCREVRLQQETGADRRH